MARAFGVDIAAANWIANSFLISMASTILFMGAVADWIGRELIFIGGVAVFALTSFLIPYSGSFASFLVLRCIQGLGAAMISGTAVAILASIFPERTGLAIGVNTAAVYVGTTLGPALGGFLADYAGWPSLFTLSGAVSLISVTLTTLSIDFSLGKSGRRPRFQTLSAFAVSTALVALGSAYSSSQYGLAALLSGLLTLVLTLHVEHERPLNLVEEIFKRGIFLAYMTTLLSYIATYALSILFSSFLQFEGGLRAWEAGIILLAQPLPQMILSPVAGYLADKLSPRLLTAAGMTMIALGIGSSLATYKWLTALVASLVLIGTGFAFFTSPNTTQIMRGVPRQAFALASSFLGLMRFLGQSLSTSILTALMLALKPFMASMEAALIVYTIAATCGVITAMFSGSN